MTPEERAGQYVGQNGDHEGYGAYMPDLPLERAVEWLVPLIRQAENDALERAAALLEAAGHKYGIAAAGITRALKHPE